MLDCKSARRAASRADLAARNVKKYTSPTARDFFTGNHVISAPQSYGQSRRIIRRGSLDLRPGESAYMPKVGIPQIGTPQVRLGKIGGMQIGAMQVRGR